MQKNTRHLRNYVVQLSPDSLASVNAHRLVGPIRCFCIRPSPPPVTPPFSSFAGSSAVRASESWALSERFRTVRCERSNHAAPAPQEWLATARRRYDPDRVASAMASVKQSASCGICPRNRLMPTLIRGAGGVGGFPHPEPDVSTRR
jgi:hypothetical protein